LHDNTLCDNTSLYNILIHLSSFCGITSVADITNCHSYWSFSTSGRYLSMFSFFFLLCCCYQTVLRSQPDRSTSAYHRHYIGDVITRTFAHSVW